MAGKESEAGLEEDDEDPRSSPKAAKEKNSKAEVVSKSSSRKQEETRIQQVLSRSCDKKEKSNKPESEKAQKEAEDDKVDTPYDTRIRAKRQKITKEGVEESRTSPSKDQELIMATSEEEEEREEVNKVKIADGDAEEQDKNKRLTDDVECLSSRVGDVGRTLELKVSCDKEESTEAGTSEDQRKQNGSNADIIREDGPMRMRKLSVRDADDVTENGPMRRRELSVRDADDVTENGPMRMRKQSIRDADDVTENGLMRMRKQSVRDADDVTENGPMRRRELSVRDDDDVTENGPVRMRKQSVRDADDVTENGPMRMRKQSLRDAEVVTDDGPMRMRELSAREADDVTENGPMRRRKLSVRDADDVTENGPMRMRKQSVRHDDDVTENGPVRMRKQSLRDAEVVTDDEPMRRRELSVRDDNDVTENGPVRMRKQSLRDDEVVTDDGPIAKRIRTRLGAVREAEEGTAEGSVTRVGDGRGNQQVKVGEGGDMTTRPPWRDGRRRRCRTKYSKEQLMAMEELFMKNRYPDIVEREDLAERIGLTEDRIQVWFQNRRSRWRARERKMQKAAEGVAARCSEAASQPDVPSNSAGATSQPARPLPVLIIPAAGFPMMQQYFSAMSSGNVTDGAKDHRSTGMPMVFQCPPADHSQHAQGAAPTTSSNSSAETSNVTTSSVTKPASNVTTSSTVTRPRTIAPKLDPQKLPFPYTIGFAYFPSQGAGTKGLANRENQTVSASLVIPANQGQLGSVQGHRGGGGPGPTLSPLLRAVESELQAKNVPVSAPPATPRNVAKNRNASKEACSSSMQLRSRSVRPIAPMPTGSRTTQRRHSTGARHPPPADDPQEPTVGDGTARKTQVESMVMSQSVTPLSATRHRSSIAGQREGFSQIDSHPSTSMLTSLGTGFTRIDHSGRIHAQHSHESSPVSPVPFQPIQRRRSRTFSEGSGGCVPTGCFLSKAYAQSRSEGAEEANSTLLTGMRRPASLQIPQPQRQGPSSSSCRVKMMADNQGVILEDHSSTEIFRVPPRRRANSLTQPVFRQDATPTLKAPAIPVSYGQSVARGSRMPQALFEDMHSPPPRARVASLSDILPCTRQNRDKRTSVFQNERSDEQPMRSVPSAASTVPPVSDVISLAFRTVNSPAQSVPKYVGIIPHATVTRSDISGRLETGPIAANKDSPRPLLQGKRDESDDVVFIGKVSSQNKPEVEQQDSIDRDNPNFVVLESSDAPHAVLNHEELTSCTDTVERGHDGNNNLSPLRQIKNVVDSIDKPDVVTVHETVPPQDHQQPYPSTQQDEHGHVNTFTGLLVGADTTSGGVTNDTIAASEVNSGRIPETCGQVVSQEQVPAEAWMEENPNSSASGIYETPHTASSRFIQVPNQHQPYTTGPTNWRSDTLPNRSDVVPVAFAPTMSHTNQQCLYTGTTSFQNQSHHGAAGSYGRMVQPWGGDSAQTQQQGAGNITMNALFLWQQNINLAQQVSLTNILARHNPFPKTQMLLTKPQPASIPTTSHILGTSNMMTPTNEQSSTGMTSHPPAGLGATPRPVGDYYTSSSTKLTYVNSNRNWFGLNGQGLAPTAMPGVQRMNNQGILSGQLSAQGLQTFHK